MRASESVVRRAGVIGLCAGAALAASSARAAQVTANWLAPVSGSWTDATKWSTSPIFPVNGTPSGTTYHAVIDAAGAAYTVDLQSVIALDRLTLDSSDATLAMSAGVFTLHSDSSVEAGVFRLTGGQVFGVGDLLIHDRMEWTGGALEAGGGLVIGPGGTLSIAAGPTAQLRRSVENHGLVEWTEGTLRLNGSTFRNVGQFEASVGAADVQTMIATSAPSEFVNEGEFRVIGGGQIVVTSTSNFLTARNEGLVDVRNGRLDFETTGTHTGEFRVRAGSELQFAKDQVFTASTLFTGAGRLRFTSGQSMIVGAFDFNGALELVSGAQVNFGAGEVSAAALVLSGGTLNGPADMVFGAGTFTNGTLNGPGELRFTDSLSWSGGLMGGLGETIVEAGATMTLEGAGVADRGLRRRLVHRGEGLWTSGSIAADGGEFVNEGTLTVQNATGSAVRFHSGGSLTRFLNIGLLEVQQGELRIHDTTSAPLTPFENVGVARVRNGGTLSVQGGGQSSGVFEIDAGGTLKYVSKTATLGTDGSIVGDGTLIAESGSLATIPSFTSYGLVDIGVLRIENASITSPAAVFHGDLVVGELQAAGGRVDILGSFEIRDDGPLSVAAGRVNLGSLDRSFREISLGPQSSGASLMSSGEVEAREVFHHASGQLLGGGEFRIADGAEATLGGGSATFTLGEATLINGGSAQWSSGQWAYQQGAEFINNGILTVNAGSALTTTGSSGDLFENNGTLVKTGAEALSLGSTSNVGIVFRNSGEIDVESGVVALRWRSAHTGSMHIAAGATMDFFGAATMEAGSTVEGAGNLRVSQGGINSLADIAIGGSLTLAGGSSTLGGPVSAGSLVVSGGTQTFNGQTSAASAAVSAGTLVMNSTLETSQLVWTGGGIVGSGLVHLLPGGSAALNTGAKSVSVDVLNDGAINWSAGNLTLQLGAVLTNEGSFAMASNAALTLSAGAAGSAFLNGGTLLKTGSSVVTVESSVDLVRNTGLVHVQAGALTIRSAAEHLGELRVDALGSVQFSQGLTIGPSAVFAGEGRIVLGPGAYAIGEQWSGFTGSVSTQSAQVSITEEVSFVAMTIQNGAVNIGADATIGDLTLTGAATTVVGDLDTHNFFLNGATTGGAGDIRIGSLWNWTSGTLEGAGQTVIGAGGSASFGILAPTTLRREVVNLGASTLGAAALRFDGGALLNQGLFTATVGVGGAASTTGLAGGGTLRNEGTIIKQGDGELRLLNNGGTMSFQNTGLLDIREGLVRLEGEALTTNEGTYAMAHAGSVHVGSDFVSATGASLSFEVGGMKDRGLSGLMTITGEASLAGTLSVETPEAFEAAWGDRWVVMTYGSVEGDFDVLDLPTEGFASRSDDFGASDLRWYAERGETEYAVGVSHIADIDHDGLIGFGDLNMIASNFNAFGSWAQGDVDGDGFVGFTDLNAVLSLFNVAAPRSVPAPGAAVVLVMAAGAMARRRGR